MSTTAKDGSIIEHVIDLSLPASKRWAEVIDTEKEAARVLFTEAKKEYQGVPEILLEGFGWLYQQYDGPFQAEFQTWAKALGLSFGEMVSVNCGYELDHLENRWSIPDLFQKIIVGCTTGICEIAGQGMVHLRSLDWDINEMGKATRLFRFKSKSHEFISVGFPGFLGVLSGMVPGEYSAMINWAPPSDMPDFHYGPSFLLRKTLEECTTYEQARHRLSHVKLSTSVFYTLCGKETGQACVIERSADSFKIRSLDNGLEAQSNNYVSTDQQDRNALLHTAYKADPLIKTTEERRDTMLKQLQEVKKKQAADLGELLQALNPAPLTNEETIQRMVFCPAKGEMQVERSLAKDKSAPNWERFSWKSSK